MEEGPISLFILSMIQSLTVQIKIEDHPPPPPPPSHFNDGKMGAFWFLLGFIIDSGGGGGGPISLFIQSKIVAFYYSVV